MANRTAKRLPPPDSIANLRGRRRELMSIFERNAAFAISQEEEKPDAQRRAKLREQALEPLQKRLKDLDKRERALKKAKSGGDKTRESVDFLDFVGT